MSVLRRSLHVLLPLCAASAPAYNDFHYPTEEASEMAGVRPPTACGGGGGWSAVFQGPDVCVLERSFEQWGMMALLDAANTSNVRLLRKSIGLLSGIKQPRHSFSADYFEKIASSLADYPSEVALKMENAPGFADAELSYGSLAQQLAPARDITEISLASDVVKFVVSHSGRVKCSVTDITEVQNLSAPVGHPPSGAAEQKVVFDPADHLERAKWPRFDFENSKSGLLGGFLRISNLGAFSVDGGGFELVALADASFHATPPIALHKHGEDQGAAVACIFSAPANDTYITGCPKRGCTHFASLAASEAACEATPDCGGITEEYGKYQLRGCGPTGASGVGERSYLITNKEACRPTCSLPRLPHINYSPAVYVRLREQSPADTDRTTPASFRYWRASNSTPPVSVSAADFYSNLRTFLNFSDSTFEKHAASIRLPGSEGQRQRDQALSGLLLASNNYVGNQANYGDGIPYWSYGRQDNGSLALIPTTVDDALLDFGLCDTALAHIGFWLENYLTADGQIKYFTWVGVVDGVGDIGRVASLYLKARRQCAGCEDMPGAPSTACAWGEKYKPVLLALGRRMLALKAAGTDGRPASAQRGPVRPECKGLVAGCPEADWSHFAVDHSPDNETWYPVNLWLQRAMAEIADFLPQDDELGAQLRGNASEFRAQLAASVAACTVPANASGFAHPLMLPPFARKRGEFAVFRNMTKDVRAPIEAHDLASYTNCTCPFFSAFPNVVMKLPRTVRFWAEMLLADTLPREIETGLLAWHNRIGGRLGGASRFMDHLDDFPSSAWAYAALTNNKTSDFHALLYGHMATYSSRGTFHATEQLQIESDGDAYRHYSPTYKGDVSLCVPTAVEVARLTRWQLVFEPARSDNGYRQIWLARGAPRRWFRDPAGFGVGENTRYFPLSSGGALEFKVSTVPATQSATFHVTVRGNARLEGTRFVLRWPGKLQEHSANSSACTVVQVEASSGLVAVTPDGGGQSWVASFSVSGRWE